ncbi:MAG: hypothetical protein HZC17_09815 [Candidatus Omnitrophica bacterium]|nr:hypothetical protein [Candidatus Omnitrophota bacterium]
MKTLKIAGFVLMLLAFAASAFAGNKYYVPSWGMAQGDITTYPKAHEARAPYTPEMVTSLDKQGKPWFQSTLNPQNLRREDSKPNIFDVFDARK